jgi:hypothetical protein
MAKPTAPLLSFGALGTIAKTVTFSKWKGRAYVRQHVIPANPQTAEQTLTRNAFSFANSAWKIGGPLLRAPWDRFATGQVLTGRNEFMGRFVNENRPEVDLLSWNMSPGAKGGLPLVSAVLTSPGANDILVTCVTPTPPTGWTVTATVAAAIRDQDPQTEVLYTTTEDEDVGGLLPLLPDLTTAVLYVVGAWIQWAKPDGSIAYSVATMGTFTPSP